MMMSRPSTWQFRSFKQLHIARTDLRVAVAGKLEEVNLTIDADFTNKIGKENKRTIQHADEHRNRLLVILADLCASCLTAVLIRRSLSMGTKRSPLIVIFS